ncbi:zinc finger protein ZFAT isoform X2 [Clupea harengus]|uniref:Zinc finger protein ZFAT isoform X2 n=1 Tax=Clupea harengus TaxID=7950 RepID=A0A6P8G8I4_CLUHA|nr:zinc finger protein ZFAT isoform X2 [Clupea harengus]
MDASNPGVTSIFMCKICNVFSSSKTDLLSHVSEIHNSEEINPDDIIIPLKPLSTQSSEISTDGPIKRKRGRPKGSTRRVCSDNGVLDSASVKTTQKEKQKKIPEVSVDLTEDNSESTSLECKRCNRKFSNKRQITKHICFVALKEDNDNDAANSDVVADSEASIEDRVDEGSEKEDKLRTPKRARTHNSEKVSAKESESAAGPVNPIISVVLAAHEAIPGATKIVPIEASPADIIPSADTDPGSQDTSQKRGYQEYAIQQAAYEVPLKSNRVGQTQLKIFTCEYCNKVFKFRHSLQAHLRIHTNEKPFKCSQCDYASAIKANLSVHMRKHTGEKFSCEHCSFSCLSKGHLKVHVERVHQKIKRHCRFCKKKYSDIKNLLKHIRETHDMTDRKVKEIYDENRLQTREGKRQLLYDCQVCERKFKNELDRDRHMMIHGTKRPFGCELCDHGSTKLPALQAHIRKHPFIYVCAICLQKFVSSLRLKAHLLEAHADVDESAGFTDSIQNSFCLLKPGDDIQREMLKQDELQITEELSLLNAHDEALIPELGNIEEQVEQAQSSEGLTTEDDLLVQQTQDALISPDGSVVDSDGTVINSCVVQETKVVTDQEVISEETQEQLQLQENQPPLRCSDTNVSTDAEEVLPVPLENSAEDANNDGTFSSPSLMSGETNTPSEASQSQAEMSEVQVDTVPNQEEDVKWVPNEEITSFRQIIDQMQKKQLTMELFERIRKVYGDLECEYCGKLYWYQVHYNTHVRTHTREHLHYCTQCSYSSITKNCLKRHVIQKHSNILLKCPEEGCQYCTPDKYKLQAHQKTHSDKDKRVLACPVCEETVAEDKIKSHLKTRHPDAPLDSIFESLGISGETKGKIGKKASKCPYCDRFFKRNGADLQQHIWAHEGVKPFKCSICDYASRSKSNLKAHMNRHNSEKTHLCDLCGKKFKSKCSLKSHKLMHTADGKQFKCTECDYMAVQKPQLLRHMEQHASFKPFRCAHCHYSCNISGSLKRHYHKKHPNEQYCNAGSGTTTSDSVIEQGGFKCPVCNYVYGTKWEMNRHLKNKHGLKVVESDSHALGQWEVVESLEEQSTQFLHITETEDSQGTEEAVTALQDLHFTTQNGVVSATTAEGLDPAAVNILQQIIELGSENTDGTVASVVAMAPGTVTVVEQVGEEEQQADHAMIIQDALQQASVGMGEEHHLVVSSDDMEGIKTVTVYTQGEDASQFIVYVQTDEQMTEAL